MRIINRTSEFHVRYLFLWWFFPFFCGGFLHRAGEES
jgi:hypothetical protein